MSLPRFFSRVKDSIGPLLVGEADTRELLASTSVLLEAPTSIEEHPYHVAGLMLLANLCARLYPTIRIVAPSRVVDDCRVLVTQINPHCELIPEFGATNGTVAWACASSNVNAVHVAPAGWEVLIDLPEASRIHRTNMLVALAAATIGASELFRDVFAAYLAKPRRRATPGRFNVLTHSPTAATLPDLPPDIALGRVHLVGAGAVGQAALYALARISATGTITVVDPEDIELSNLQRYVLTTDADVGIAKCEIAERTMRKSRIDVVSVRSTWSQDLPGVQGAEVICAAVDSEETRIAIQAALPRRVYNAWTQPGDIGWSRHERFGLDPCAACLYWPMSRRPSYSELVARAIHQHELRVLAYLIHKIPVGAPLRVEQIPKLPQMSAPPDAGEWTERTLLADVAIAMRVEPEEVEKWKESRLQDLYHEGVCGGALLAKLQGVLSHDVAVPLAHQSVLAGIMLAAQLVVAAHPDLRAYRSIATEERLDLLAGFPQLTSRPRKRTPACICSDPDFIEVYQSKWPGPGPRLAEDAGSHAAE